MSLCALLLILARVLPVTESFMSRFNQSEGGLGASLMQVRGLGGEIEGRRSWEQEHKRLVLPDIG